MPLLSGVNTFPKPGSSGNAGAGTEDFSGISALAQRHILGVRGEPLFHADWTRALFIHFEVDATTLQTEVPFAVDLREGRACVSLVAFTMCGMRPRLGGRFGALLFRPIATHEFLNLRAYVKHRGEAGIYFLAEWLSNPISVRLGPLTFGLPYRHGRIRYCHTHEDGRLRGRVVDVKNLAALDYSARLHPSAAFRPCVAGTADEFLMERYTAFTARGAARRFFRIWHPPWPQAPVRVVLNDSSLLTRSWPWFHDARIVGANYTPGIENVWMGRPHRI
jgi:uncharacterized protein YqjF (DUF2071 family)